MTEDVRVLAKGNLKAIESNSYLRPLGQSEAVHFSSSMPDEASSVVFERAEKPAVSGKPPMT